MEEDLRWLRDLNTRSWKEHERLPHGIGWTEDLVVAPEDFTRFAWLCEIYRNEFIYEPGPGVWGFGVSLNLGLYHQSPYPNVPNNIEWLICLTSKQMFPGERGQAHKQAYAFITAFVYTDQNKKMREEAGLKDPLRELWYYDY